MRTVLALAGTALLAGCSPDLSFDDAGRMHHELQQPKKTYKVTCPPSNPDCGPMQIAASSANPGGHCGEHQDECPEFPIRGVGTVWATDPGAAFALTDSAAAAHRFSRGRYTSTPTLISFSGVESGVDIVNVHFGNFYGRTQTVTQTLWFQGRSYNITSTVPGNDSVVVELSDGSFYLSEEDGGRAVGGTYLIDDSEVMAPW